MSDFLLNKVTNGLSVHGYPEQAMSKGCAMGKQKACKYSDRLG